MTRLWTAIPRRVGYVLAPFAFLIGTVIGGASRL
jgi:nucleoside permease NupC